MAHSSDVSHASPSFVFRYSASTSEEYMDTALPKSRKMHWKCKHCCFVRYQFSFQNFKFVSGRIFGSSLTVSLNGFLANRGILKILIYYCTLNANMTINYFPYLLRITIRKQLLILESY